MIWYCMTTTRCGCGSCSTTVTLTHLAVARLMSEARHGGRSKIRWMTFKRLNEPNLRTLSVVRGVTLSHLFSFHNRPRQNCSCTRSFAIILTKQTIPLLQVQLLRSTNDNQIIIQRTTYKNSLSSNRTAGASQDFARIVLLLVIFFLHASVFYLLAS